MAVSLDVKPGLLYGRGKCRSAQDNRDNTPDRLVSGSNMLKSCRSGKTIAVITTPAVCAYHGLMSITSQIQKDIVECMKTKQELRLSTLRMVKAALKNKEIDKRTPLDEKEEMQVLSTLIKQRHDSSEQFTKGNRPELAARELEEIVFIESYLPKAVGPAEIDAAVKSVIAAMGSPTAKEMGAIMKNVMAQFAGARVDGKLVSEAVKKALAG